MPRTALQLTESAMKSAPSTPSAAPAPQATNKRQSRDNEKPLVEDIRLLGRILGDVIRAQEGAEAYELVEQIRKLSVAFRRDADHDADKALKKLLKGLSGERAVSVIRAFTYFSHLANLAKTATTSAAAPSTSAQATPRRAASTWPCSACAGRASHHAPSARPWRTAMSRRY